jgi:hypothetical protein
MPEAIDFDQIARAILDDDDPELLGDLLEGMRQVWNARGAADAIVVAEDHDYVHAIKALDC